MGLMHLRIDGYLDQVIIGVISLKSRKENQCLESNTIPHPMVISLGSWFLTVFFMGDFLGTLTTLSVITEGNLILIFSFAARNIGHASNQETE